MSAEEDTRLDLFAICREILLQLLDGKMPADVDKTLDELGVPAGDREQLINLTVVSAQAVNPVIEQKINKGEAARNLVAQGMGAEMAESMVNLILDVMTERAEAKVGDQNLPEIDEKTARILMKLGLITLTDLQNGGDETAMAQALHNLEDIADYRDVYNREAEFIANVKLAASAAQRALAQPLPEVIKQLGIDQKPPYVGVLALFFMRVRQEP
ncbi:hypothetical protein AGMMS49959_11770 [Planctomycetales bacterium]|nr:hypothetical protein AGMMS49959_11770 [Planctomycetales bacterium]